MNTRWSPLEGVSDSQLHVLEDDAANASLIAAAPDLLALARQYASECGECDGGGYVLGRNAEPTADPCPDCADIRSVIAKATQSGRHPHEQSAETRLPLPAGTSSSKEGDVRSDVEQEAEFRGATR
jgi:hypothetical protein